MMKKRIKQLYKPLFQRLAAWPKPHRNRVRYLLYPGIPSILLLLLALHAYSAVATKRPEATFIAQNKIEPTINAVPVRLRIPAIGIDTHIEAVDLTASGDMAVPVQNPWTDVGWYATGPSPGQQGSAVIDGHLDRPGGPPAVFWYLRDLGVGNEVDVVNNDGELLRFHVTHIAYYAPQDAPLQKIFGDTSGIYLNLITSAGDWSPSQHQTTLRLVIYTTFVGKQ